MDLFKTKFISKTIKIFIIVLSLSGVGLFGMDRTTDWRQPLKKCWTYETPNRGIINLASDNEQLYLTTSINLRALNPSTGKLIWKTDLNGRPYSNMYQSDKKLFVEMEKADKTKYQGVFEKNTGLPFFKTKTPVSRISFSNMFWNLETDKDSNLFKKIVNRLEKNSLPVGNFYRREISADLSVFTNGSGSLIFVQDQKIVKVLKSVTMIHFDEKQIIYGTRVGLVKGIDKFNLAVKWEFKTGGEISDIRPAGNNVLIASKDNFIYSLKKNKTKLNWKIRFAGRLIGWNQISDSHIYVLSQGSSFGIIVDLKRGKIVNRIDFGVQTYFISAPVSLGKFLFSNTSRGLYAHSSGC